MCVYAALVCVCPAGEQPRVLGAKLIIQRIPEMAGDGAAILVGDLNAGGQPWGF